MKKLFVSLSVLSLLSVGQVQALEVHPVGLAKSAVSKTVSLTKSALSTVGGMLSRTLRVAHVTASELTGHAQGAVETGLEAVDQGSQFILRGGE